MLLEYAGESKLYVPLTRMDLVQKYRGAGEGTAPPLDRLGGATWTRTKSRVKAKMRDMADELLKLYAERRMAEGFAFSPDSNWQREFEDAFEFTETKDQLTPSSEIKRDMEAPIPWTACCAATSASARPKWPCARRSRRSAMASRWPCSRPPPCSRSSTTKRSSAASRQFPVRVEMLSRFRSPKEMKASLEDLADGKVDIVIGTHRLLSKDVEFRDLGLLIVDEEQRFGVRHKERLKQMTQERGRADHERHAHSAHAAHVAARASATCR
jgi:transcription-repair coupling factor (superfamily II helicase)